MVAHPIKKYPTFMEPKCPLPFSQNPIILNYGGVSKGFRTESIAKYTLTTINTR